MHVFTYGTLMFPEVMVALTGREFTWEDIEVPGFDRRTLAGRIYPGLFKAPGRHVEGRLYFNVDASSIGVLEAFEDAFYERRMIEVCSPAKGRMMALAYVIPRACLHLLSAEAWDPVAFRLRHLYAWVEMCQTFRADVEAK